jgi:hypothetical protein
MSETALADRAILRTRHVLSTCMIKGEPSFEEMLSDPIVLVRAKCAGLSPQALRALCISTRELLKRRAT